MELHAVSGPRATDPWAVGLNKTIAAIETGTAPEPRNPGWARTHAVALSVFAHSRLVESPEDSPYGLTLREWLAKIGVVLHDRAQGSLLDEEHLESPRRLAATVEMLEAERVTMAARERNHHPQWQQQSRFD